MGIHQLLYPSINQSTQTTKLQSSCLELLSLTLPATPRSLQASNRTHPRRSRTLSPTLPTTPAPRASLTPLDLPRFLRPSKTLLPRVLRRLSLSQFTLQTSKEDDNATVMYFM